MKKKTIELIGKTFKELSESQQELIIQDELELYYKFEPMDTLRYFMEQMNEKYSCDLEIDDFQYDLYEGWIEVSSKKVANIIINELEEVLSDYLFQMIMDLDIDSRYVHVGRYNSTDCKDLHISISSECSDELEKYIYDQASIIFDKIMKDFKDFHTDMMDVENNAYDDVRERCDEYIYFVDEHGHVYEREEYCEMNIEEAI
jgi:hypothetical protein